MKKTLTKLIILIFFFLIFIKKDIMYITIYKTTIIWFKNIVPNLFPMFIITSLIIESNLIINICNIFGKFFKKIFNTSIYGFFVFFLSLFTGCPSNAKYLLDLKNNDLITDSEINKLILYTTNYNPLLIMSLLSQYLDKKYILKIIFILIITNIILGLLVRNKPVTLINNNYKKKKINISSIIKNTTDTLLMILGTLIFFNIIINLLPTNNLILKNLLNGLLEITTALNSLKNISLNNNLLSIIVLIYLSFGGLSIHVQIQSILPNIKYKEYLSYRLLAIFISLGLYFISSIPNILS